MQYLSWKGYWQLTNDFLRFSCFGLQQAHLLPLFVSYFQRRNLETKKSNFVNVFTCKPNKKCSTCHCTFFCIMIREWPFSTVQSKYRLILLRLIFQQSTASFDHVGIDFFYFSIVLIINIMPMFAIILWTWSMFGTSYRNCNIDKNIENYLWCWNIESQLNFFW